MLDRIGLLGTDHLPTWKTAFALALLAWLPPMLLALAQTMLEEGYRGWAYFEDLTVYTRYLVAIVAMVITERLAERRISALLRHFPEGGLLAPQLYSDYWSMVRRADGRVSWPLVEAVLLVFALLWSWASFYYVSSISVSGWEEWSDGTQSYMSWAGISAELLSNPVFLFLALRWTWRFLVWTSLLFQVSRLPLQLTAIHPDRAGGLGFLSLFPGIFVGLVFGLSCVIASSLLKTMALLHPSQLFIWLAIAAWVLLVALIVFAPLTLFSRALSMERERGLAAYAELLQEHHRLFQENWFRTGRDVEQLLGGSDPSSVVELNAIFESVQHMRVIPLNGPAVLQIIAAALTPFLLVVFSLMPLPELLQWLLGAII